MIERKALAALFPDHPERLETNATKRMTASGRLEIQSGQLGIPFIAPVSGSR